MDLFGGRAMAFTIEGLSLRILTFSGKKIESWYSVPLGPNLLRDGLVSAPDKVGEVMAEAIQTKSSPRSGVLCALPSAGSTSQTLTLPQLSKGKLEDVVQREVKRLVGGSADTDYIYWQQLPAVGAAKKQAVYALAIPRNNVVNMVEVCRTAGVKIKGMELKPFALTRAVNCKSGIIVHCEIDSIEIVIIDKSFPALFRNIPVKDAKPGPDIACQNLLRELPFTIDYYNRSHPESNITPDTAIYMSGELALDPEVIVRVSEASGRTVTDVDPQVQCPPNFPLAQYIVNIGLMLREKW